MFVSKGATLGSGIVLALIGFVFLVFPGFTLSFFATLAGIGLVVAGISAIVSWRNGLRDTIMGTAALVFGILGIVLGLVCLVHPFAVAATFTWLVALCVLIAGILQLVTLTRAEGLPGRGIALAAAVLVIIFGVLAMAWPPMIVQLVGVSLAVDGVSFIILALLSDSARY